MHCLILYRDDYIRMLNYVMILQDRVVYLEAVNILSGIGQNLKELDHVARVVFSHDSQN